MGSPDEVAAWFKNERGIDRPTLSAFKIETTGDKVLMPYPNGKKERPDPTRPLREGERRFYFDGGKTPELFVAPDNKPDGPAFLVEGETDVMRLWQELRAAGETASVYGLSGVDTWNSRYDPEHGERMVQKYLARHDRVFVILDNDDDYMVRSSVDRAWRTIRQDLPAGGKRITLPPDVKDICEYFGRYDLEMLGLLTSQKGVSRYKPLDLTLPPPPTNWFLEGWIAMGDVVVIAGVGGLGKSWITMLLTMMALTGGTEALGIPVRNHGDVLYVDEENPNDVVYQRLHQLGFDPMQHSEHLRYLWNQGIKLDRDPDALIDEAMDFRPKFIALDSFTQLHSKEENVSGDIAPLMNDAIKPLAREVGAAVVLIHHHDKGARGPRGSTAIVNSADAVIECYGLGDANPTKFRMRLTKSRRGMSGKEIIVGINDQPDGTVTLDHDVPMDFPF